MFVCYTSRNYHMGNGFEYWISYQDCADMCWYLGEQCLMIPPDGWNCE